MLLQRILLLSYDKASKRIHLRHYSVSAQPSGVSKGVKALVSQRAVPDMSHVQDVSEFLSKSGYGSVGLQPLPLPLPLPVAFAIFFALAFAVVSVCACVCA